jgi:hypothetical protein
MRHVNHATGQVSNGMHTKIPGHKTNERDQSKGLGVCRIKTLQRILNIQSVRTCSGLIRDWTLITGGLLSIW